MAAESWWSSWGHWAGSLGWRLFAPPEIEQVDAESLARWQRQYEAAFDSNEPANPEQQADLERMHAELDQLRDARQLVESRGVTLVGFTGAVISAAFALLKDAASLPSLTSLSVLGAVGILVVALWYLLAARRAMDWHVPQLRSELRTGWPASVSEAEWPAVVDRREYFALRIAVIQNRSLVTRAAESTDIAIWWLSRAALLALAGLAALVSR